jgi:hypothetical protein
VHLGASANMANDCARIREGVKCSSGSISAAAASRLGGPDRRTLFMLTAEWRGTEAVENVIEARTGQVLVAEAPAPGAGWP